MAKFLVHIHTGPENPTKAALGFLVALTALKSGHEVDLFLAGDAVHLLAPETVASLEGLGDRPAGRASPGHQRSGRAVLPLGQECAGAGL